MQIIHYFIRNNTQHTPPCLLLGQKGNKTRLPRRRGNCIPTAFKN